MWQTQIQAIEYDLNDTKRIKKKQFALTLYSFAPSDMNFQTILMSKKSTHLNHSYLNYVLNEIFKNESVMRALL